MTTSDACLPRSTTNKFTSISSIKIVAAGGGGGGSGGGGTGTGGGDNTGSGTGGTGGSETPAAMLVLVNKERAAVGAAPLTFDARLTAAAAAHSADQVARNTMTHYGVNGSTVADRVTAQNYVWSYVGENVASGVATVAQIMSGARSEGGAIKIVLKILLKKALNAVCVHQTTTNSPPPLHKHTHKQLG
jgi:hypothetical protein